MIVFDLSCSEGHRFEGWFSSSEDYAAQIDGSLLMCPQCGCKAITKAPMAPAVPVKGNQRPAQSAQQSDRHESEPAHPQGGTSPVTNSQIPPEVEKAMRALAEAQAKALQNSRWVGDGFAEESRAMHYGEKDLEIIHGKATLDEAQQLLDEGVMVSPLPFPIVEPDKLN